MPKQKQSAKKKLGPLIIIIQLIIANLVCLEIVDRRRTQLPKYKKLSKLVKVSQNELLL